MAILNYQHDSNIVILTLEDTVKIKAALNAYCSTYKVRVSDVAEEFDLSRQQFYTVINSREIELDRLDQLQKKLNFSLISSGMLDRFLLKINYDLCPIQKKHSINPRGTFIKLAYENDWIQHCEAVNVNAYYAFLYLRFISSRQWFDQRDYIKSYNLKNDIAHNYIFSKDMYSNYPNYLGSLLIENHRFKDKINFERKLDYSKIRFNHLPLDNHLKDKISNFCETALISLASTKNNFSSKFTFLSDHPISLNIPISGTSELWKKYDKKIKSIIKHIDFSQEIKSEHLKYHKNLMKEILNISQETDGLIEKINKRIKEGYILRYDSILINELRDFNKSPEKYYIKVTTNESNSINEIDMKRSVSELLMKNPNISEMPSTRGVRVGKKNYYFDLAFVYDSSNSEGDIGVGFESQIGFEFKVYGQKNNFNKLMLDRVKKVMDYGRFDKFFVIANNDFDKDLKKIAEKNHIYLLRIDEKESLLGHIGIKKKTI